MSISDHQGVAVAERDPPVGNGQRREAALLPIANKRQFMDVTGDVVERVDPVFYGEPKAAAFKALG